MFVTLTSTVPSIAISVFVPHSTITQAIPWVLVYLFLLRTELNIPLIGARDNACNATPDNGCMNAGPVVTFIL